MPVKPCPLSIDANHREIENRGTPMFPCGGYTLEIGHPIYQGIPWHWHDEAEVLTVNRGALTLELMNRRYQIQQGEGAFINAGVLHSATALGERRCEVQSLVFHPSLIAGAAGSSVEQRYVRPLLECCEMPGVPLKNDVLWQDEAVQSIRDAFDLYGSESFGYEFQVREKLSHIWFLIVNHHQNLLSRQTPGNMDVSRLKDMLSFIHEHCAEPITLSDIAKAAAIGQRECLRCFKRTIGQTPMNYLLKHRISSAAGLLEKTDLSITEICRHSGFESPSYFSFTFKKLVEMTPKEYRRLHQT